MVVNRDDYPKMTDLLFVMPSVVDSPYEVNGFTYRGVSDDINDQYDCILSYGDKTYNLSGNIFTNQRVLKCSEVCEELADKFIQLVGQQIIKKSSLNELEEHKEDMYFKVKGVILRVSSKYKSIVASGLYKDINGCTMIWGGNVHWLR